MMWTTECPFWVASNVSRVYPWGSLEKLNLCKIIPCDILSVTLPDNHLHTKKQLINLLYNDMKNLLSILNCYIGPNCVASINDAKPISLCDNQLFACFYNSIMKINCGQTRDLLKPPSEQPPRLSAWNVTEGEYFHTRSIVHLYTQMYCFHVNLFITHHVNQYRSVLLTKFVNCTSWSYRVTDFSVVRVQNNLESISFCSIKGMCCKFWSITKVSQHTHPHFDVNMLSQPNNRMYMYSMDIYEHIMIHVQVLACLNTSSFCNKFPKVERMGTYTISSLYLLREPLPTHILSVPSPTRVGFCMKHRGAQYDVKVIWHA